MVRTYGLTHLGLAVQDPERSLRFYRSVFGVEEVYRDEDSIQVRGPVGRDIIAFERDARNAGAKGGVTHIGFRLRDPKDIDLAVREVKRAGGKVLRRGEFVPGEPYVFFLDPDGYEVEIWFE